MATKPSDSPPVPLILEQQHITAVEGIVPTLQNIVAIVNLDCRLDLRTIARNAEYNPKTTALIFASGKMVVTSAKSEDDSRLASRKYARIVQKPGLDAKFSEFKIQNIVGSCNVKFPTRALFPGLIYRMTKPNLPAHLRLEQDRPDRHQSFPLFVLSYIRRSTCARRTPDETRPAPVPASARVASSYPNYSVCEEIYTAFNTIYTVLCEFRKP
ncbi:hypothetical protein B0H14DRAFT_3898530 [Mycena olivaceomarginata]|nr:hypothetical protein B0H14DRAFT_3898530 [Mycena olivaceomarginata]